MIKNITLALVAVTLVLGCSQGMAQRLKPLWDNTKVDYSTDPYWKACCEKLQTAGNQLSLANKEIGLLKASGMEFSPRCVELRKSVENGTTNSLFYKVSELTFQKQRIEQRLNEPARKAAKEKAEAELLAKEREQEAAKVREEKAAKVKLEEFYKQHPEITR